jgi:DNA-binding response OmpR family regulator
MSRILVVDDNHDILQVMLLLLRTRGFDVEITPKGEEIFNTVERFTPDLILMDVYLGGWDGRDICQQLKSSNSTKHIPVIMFSAYQQAEESTRKFGADDFIGKPFDMEELIGKINHLLAVSKKRTELRIEQRENRTARRGKNLQ